MLVVALLLAAPVAGCSAPAQVPGTTVTVAPRTSVADQPVQIRVAGLVGGQRATVQVSSTDAAGVRWRASAVYRADAAVLAEMAPMHSMAFTPTETLVGT